MAVPADKIVFTSGMVTLTSTCAASLLPETYGGHGELPSVRLLVGTSFSFVGLGIMADFAPGFAGPLSVAIAITALTYYGIPLLDNYMAGDKHNPVGSRPE